MTSWGDRGNVLLRVDRKQVQPTYKPACRTRGARGDSELDEPSESDISAPHDAHPIHT